MQSRTRFFGVKMPATYTFYTFCGLWLVITMEIKLQFLSLSVITYPYCPLPVTISLENIICWPLNRGKKAINDDLATTKRWPLNRDIKYSTNRCHVAVHLFSNRSQMTSKCGKNKKVAHKAIAECVTVGLTTFWCLLFSNRSRKTSKCGKNSMQWHTWLLPRVPLLCSTFWHHLWSITPGYSRVCHWCSYHILTSSVIYYWTDAQQHGIYLFYIIKKQSVPRLVALDWNCSSLSHFSTKKCVFFLLPAFGICPQPQQEVFLCLHSPNLVKCPKFSPLSAILD